MQTGLRSSVYICRKYTSTATGGMYQKASFRLDLRHDGKIICDDRLGKHDFWKMIALSQGCFDAFLFKWKVSQLESNSRRYL